MYYRVAILSMTIDLAKLALRKFIHGLAWTI